MWSDEWFDLQERKEEMDLMEVRVGNGKRLEPNEWSLVRNERRNIKMIETCRKYECTRLFDKKQ